MTGSGANRPVRQRSRLTSGVLKVLGLFSGLQAFGVLVSVVKMKLVALWLQATGVGLFGIYNTTMETLSTLSELGLRQSTVRDVAQASDKDPGRLARLVATVRSWSCLAGLSGAVILCSLSPFLSLWIFGDMSRWWSFVIVSASMLMNSMVGGEQAILQGLGKLRDIARGVFYGSLSGLALSIPMFYLLGDLSVMLSIVAYSLSILICISIARHRDQKPVRPSVKLLKEGSGFVKLGAYMALAAFITSLSQVVFIAYLNRTVSTAEVGYYQAGSTLVIRYVGLILSAVGMEFYPRVSKYSRNPSRVSLFVSHEIVLLLSVLGPMMALFLTFRPLIVNILYSPEFEVILPFITWAIVNVVFRASSVCLAYVIVARGDGRTYLLVESVDALIGLSLNILLYHIAGLEGIGMAYVLWFFSYLLITGTVYRVRYRMKVSRSAVFSVMGWAAGGAAMVATTFLLPAPVLWIETIISCLAGGIILRRLTGSRRRSAKP